MAFRASANSQFELGGLIERLSRPHRAGKPVRARRADDHLVLDLFFENLRVEHGEGVEPRLVRVDAARAATLIVEFPPQSFGEEAFEFEPDAQPALHALPTARVRMSGASRLAFTMPAELGELPFSLAAVLRAMEEWAPRLDARALPDQAGLLGLPDTAHAELNRLLLARVGPAAQADLGHALLSGTRRISEVAAGGLPGDQVAGVLWAAIREETAALVRRHPALGEGDLHTATLAALALGSAAKLNELAGSARIERDEANVLQHLPYLALLLAIPRAPAPNSTALELPYRLFLSPIGQMRWEHEALPVQRHGRTALWHTRLESSTAQPAPVQIRALWSPDLEHGSGKRPFLMSLDAQDRGDLVRLTADWNQRQTDARFAYRPHPASAKRLHLSALGALLDAGGDWDVRPKDVEVEQWRHVATLGRDHYVRIVKAGFLMPFGHAASLIRVTERTFVATQGDPQRRIAVLRQREFILVKERVRRYADSKAQHQFGGRNFPFDEVEVLTRVTPDLERSDVSIDPPGPSGASTPTGIANGVGLAFWPQSKNGKELIDFRFELAATDRSGERVRFSLPLLFVGETVNASKSPGVREAYAEASDQRRSAELGGANIVYEQGAGAKPDDSRLSTGRLSFTTRGEYPISRPPFPLAPNFFPEVAGTSVQVPSIQKLLGRNLAFEMTYPLVDSAHEFDNAGGVFLWAAGTRLPLGFGGGRDKAQCDSLGGLASPALSIVGLSSLTGPVSGNPTAEIKKAVENVSKNAFDPADFFQGAKLLGGIDLGSIVRAASLGAAPRFRSEQASKHLVASFEWQTDLQPAPNFIPDADQRSGSQLTMRGTVTTPLDGTSATHEATAELDNFKLDLFGFIILSFERLKFEAKPGQKPDITVQLASEQPVAFGGPLEFVNELRSYIPCNGFSGPSAISITPSGISAGFSLALPMIGVGIFTLSNVSLGCSFSLPFDARPISVRFNFSERQAPFSLTVSGLGGGGFVAIAIGSEGVQEIEAALEFGAAVAINLGLASGLVEIKAGVYFHWKEAGNDSLVALAGYVRVHGEMTLLGIASASITFNLQLGYEKHDGGSLVFGEATLVIEIEVLFLSCDVSVHCRREFSGGPADPKFIDLIPDQSVWTEYCAAFAAEAP